MTIRRGDDWGAPGVPPNDLVWFDDDHSAAAAVARGTTVLGLRAGDMARTLGAGGSVSSVEFPLDVVRLETSLAGSTTALSHVIVRRRLAGWWRGAVTVVMNSQFRRNWDVAPRGHPNDGRVEVFEVAASMSVRQRWAASRRLPTGTHLPHPMITSSSTRHLTLVIPAKSAVEVDGRHWFTTAESTELMVEVVPDAITVWTAGDDEQVPLAP